MDPLKIIDGIHDSIEKNFKENKRIMTFYGFMELFTENPYKFSRNSVQYILDMFDYFGNYKKEIVGIPYTHYKLFDIEFENGKDRLINHEEAQEIFYRILYNFASDRKITKLIMFHGPNGSAKSTFVSCIMKGLEYYSLQDEGALYKFNWVFPIEKIIKGGIGFSASSSLSKDNREKEENNSYALLSEKEIAARLQCELKDNPLFLIPRDERLKLFEKLFKDKDKYPRFAPSEYIIYGDLCHKCKQIYETLLNSYRGNYKEVLKHIQIERFYISRKYRVGAVTLDPQMHVDAESRQLTMDKSLSYLPPLLQNINLYEQRGDLVDANRGIIEYSDLLKRPIEAYKYLLSTSEKATVSLPNMLIFLDLLLVANSNDKYLESFKTIPDFPSFKGRLELIQMPYILNYLEEKKIYDDQIPTLVGDKHIAPHTTLIASLWAVLTRLNKPDLSRYPSNVASVLRRLTALDKAELYATGKISDKFNEEEKKILKSVIKDLYLEQRNIPNYEGKIGASPREIKTIILNASQSQKFRCLSPLAIMEELENLIKDPSIYEFLQKDTQDEFHNSKKFIEVVKERYLDIIDSEVRTSMKLIEESQYRNLFEKYIIHITHFIKKEKLLNKITGKLEDPNEEFMTEVEKILKVTEGKTQFRNEVISKIGAYSVDHPNQEIKYEEIFPHFFKRMEENFYEKRKKSLIKIEENMLKYGSEYEKTLSPEELKQVETTLYWMKNQFNYCNLCAKEAISFLLKNRYLV